MFFIYLLSRGVGDKPDSKLHIMIELLYGSATEWGGTLGDPELLQGPEGKLIQMYIFSCFISFFMSLSLLFA